MAVDVVLWVEKEDGAGAAVAARALKAKMKAEVASWFLVAPKSERSERLAYDLGMKLVVRPAHLGELGAALVAHGSAETLVLWSGAAVLTGD